MNKNFTYYNLGTFQINDLVIYGETNKKYYLIIKSNFLNYKNRIDPKKLSKNEIIDSLDRYYLSISIYLKPCPNGYILINDQSKITNL